MSIEILDNRRPRDSADMNTRLRISDNISIYSWIIFSAEGTGKSLYPLDVR